MAVFSTRGTAGVAVTLCIAGFMIVPATADAVCHYKNGDSYKCPNGFYCCDNKNCCKPRAHLYKTQWFWLVWAGVIVAAGCCACAYKHKRCRSSRFVCCGRRFATELDDAADPLEEDGSDELGNPVSIDHPFLLPPEERLIDKPPSYFEVVAQEHTEEERRTLRALLARPVRARHISNGDLLSRPVRIGANHIPDGESQAHIVNEESLPRPVQADQVSSEETRPPSAHSSARSGEGSMEDLPLLSSNSPVNRCTS